MLVRLKEERCCSVIGDVVAVGIGCAVAVATDDGTSIIVGGCAHYGWGVMTLGVSALLLFMIVDVYSLHRMPSGLGNQVLLIGVGLLLSAGVSSVVFVLFGDPASGRLCILFVCASWCMSGVFRYVDQAISLSRIYWRVLVVGESEMCRTIAGVIGKRKYLRAQVVGCISADPYVGVGDGISGGGNGARLLSLVMEKAVNYIVVADPAIDAGTLRVHLDCMKHRVKVRDYREVIEEITGKVPIEYVNVNVLIRERGGRGDGYTRYFKRSFDVVMSMIGVIVSSPIMGLAALMIRMESQGPVLYSQLRVGRDNRQFRVWKLRTMLPEADKNMVLWTKDNDERITRVGWFLRRMHIDELPQLINVLRGEMSLIGPRPEAVPLVELYAKKIPYYRERHVVTPGITGWAQINFTYGNSIEDTLEKLKYDCYYIKNRGVLLDLLIFVKTIKTVMTGKGAL